MGPAKRKHIRKKEVESGDHSSIFKDENIDLVNAAEIENELFVFGLPMSFSSSKGQHIEGQPNVEAARIGQIRRHQQFQGKKLKAWQIKRLRGVKIKQSHQKLGNPTKST
jgi:hypothetical protein